MWKFGDRSIKGTLLHFSSLFIAIENTTPGDSKPENPIDDDGKDLPLPAYKKVRLTTSRLNNNKEVEVDGLRVELFKHGGDNKHAPASLQDPTAYANY